MRSRTWAVGVGRVGVVFWWGDCEVLVIYEAVWRVGVGLELEMGGGDGWRRWVAEMEGGVRWSAVASSDGEA